MNKIKYILNILLGNAFSQIILIIGTSILVRLYSPSEIGVSGVITSILLILGIIGCARFDQFIFQHNDTYNKNLSISSGISYLISSSTILLITLLLLYTLGYISLLFVLLYPLVISFSLIQLFTSALSLEKEYSITIRGNILRSLTLIISQIFLFKLGEYGLVLGIIISQVITVTYLYINYHKITKDWFQLKIELNLYRIKDVFYSSSHSIFSAMSSQLPVFTIPFLYNMQLLGYYMLGMKLTQLPITFFTNAIRPYILSELNSILYNKNKVFKIVLYGSIFLILLSLIGIILINIFGVVFFELYAGNEWAEAGVISGVLSLWLLTSFSNVIAISYLTILAKFKLLFYYDSLVLLARSGVVIFAYSLSLDFYTFILYFSLIGGITNLTIIFYAISLAFLKKTVYRQDHIIDEI